MGLISTLPFLWLAFFGIRGSNGQRPRQICKEPLSSDCVPFVPDPVPHHYPPVPKDTDAFWNLNENREIAKDTGLSFTKDDAGAFGVPRTRLFRYFRNADIAGVSELFKEAKFELIEWPGRKTDASPSDKDATTFQAFLAQRVGQGNAYIPVNYQAPQTKFLGYLCNPLEGTHVRALGFRMRPEIVRISHRNYIPFYVTTGDNSFQNNYVQPLFVLASDLNKMAKDHLSPFCQPIVDDVLSPESKLNHVLDFAFTNGRLLLGMHCGIMVVHEINTDRPKFARGLRNPLPDVYDENEFVKDTYVKFTDTQTYREPKFPNINLISASTCCPQEVYCARQSPIAAAYSYNKYSKGDGIQEIFVSVDLGDTWDAKIISTEHTVLNLIRKLYEEHAQGSVEPYWVTEEILNLKSNGLWRENDPVVELIVNRNRDVKVNRTDEDCREIVSLQVVAEEHSVLALCRMSPAELFDENADFPPTMPVTLLPRPGVVNPPPPAPAVNATAPPDKYAMYAIFEMQYSVASPVIPFVRKTKRRLPCTLRAVDVSEYEFYEPAVIRTSKSHNLFITGCSTVIYHSVNGGQTFWNTYFYRKYDTGLHRRFRQDEKMNNPITAFDSIGDSVVFLTNEWYAFGQVNFNREFRLIMDQIALTDGVLRDRGRCADVTESNPKCTACRNPVAMPPECDIVLDECEKVKLENQDKCGVYWDTVINFASVTKFLPYYSNAGQLIFSFVAIHILRGNQVTQTFSALYAERNAIRLIDFPTRLSKAIRPYYAENQAISTNDKFKAFSKCTTFSFSLRPKYISFDVGDTAMIEVSVQDDSENLPLGIYSSQTTALKFEVTLSNKPSASGEELESHNWDVKVTALGKFKTRIERRTDAFFGSEYSKYVAVATFTVFTNYPGIRCHVQPHGSVYIDTSCAGKLLVVHEDYNRPHCGMFFNNTIKIPDFEEGKYDPELMEYWLQTRPNFYKKETDDKGVTRIKVKYDYETFGCPILPYRTDDVSPDLRVLDLDVNSNLSHTSLGLKYNLSYVLVEIHGATGFTYTKTVRDAGCVRPPQTSKQMLAEWKIRKRVIREAAQSYRGFRPDPISDPQNIWNRINYQACDIRGNFEGELSDEILDAPYEILRRNNTHPEAENMLRWVDFSKTLYIFAAIEVDKDGTFCQFRTYFAIHISGTEETDDLATIYRFVAFFLFCLLLVFLGYFVYRSHLRNIYRKTALFSRLERAAWQILFRYEKFIHEVKVKMEDDDKDAVWNRIEASEYDQELIDKSKVPANKGKPTTAVSKKTLKTRRKSRVKANK